MMQATANKIEGNVQRADNKNSLERSHLSLVKEGISDIRSEIGRIAYHSYREGVLKDEDYQNYKDLAEGSERFEISDKMLASTLEYAKNYDLKAVRIHRKIQKAISEKIASAQDEEFLMKFVKDNLQFLDQADQIEASFERKITRMKKDKERYNQIGKNPYIKNLSIQKVLNSNKIKLNKENTFLEATVPERREFLDQIEEVILKEEFNEAYKEKNLDKMRKGYLKKLRRYYSNQAGKGCLGEKTFKSFEAEVNKIDLEELKAWDDNLKEQMVDREIFWEIVRSTLKGRALAKMEKNIHKMGMSDLRPAFAKIKDDESKRLCENYDKALEKYKGKIIGNHTAGEFSVWIRKLPLKAQYEAESKLGDWEAMGKYKDLWDEIEALEDEEAKELMKSHIDVWGFTKFEAKLKEFRRAANQSDYGNESENALAKIQNSAIKKAAGEIQENLEGRGADHEDRIIRLFEMKAKSKVETPEFEEVEQQLINEKKSDQEIEVKQINSLKKEEDEEGINSEDEDSLIELDEFRKIETNDGKELKHAMIDEKQGMNNLLANYRGTTQEAELVTISVHNDAREAIQLDKKDAANIALYLKAERKKQQESSKTEQ